METDTNLDTTRAELLNDDDEQPTKIIVVGTKCRQDPELQKAIKALDIPVTFSNTGLEHIAEAGTDDLLFVIGDFQDEVFHKLHRAEARIVGPPVVIKCAKYNQTIPQCSRALYCTSMRGLIVCFTGFSKQKLVKMADLIHHMGGSIRKDFIPSKVTHLVANCTGGSKYRYAFSCGTPIMNDEWVSKAWSMRDDITVKADCGELMKHRMKPFYKCFLSFHGFSEEEKKHVEEMTLENGGTLAPIGHEDSTHLVVDDHAVKELPPISTPQFVVRLEWFWASIQIGACADETMYLFDEHKQEPQNVNKFTPTSAMSKARKRKRLKENIALLASEGEIDSPFMYAKRPSFERVSMSPNSFLDASGTPEKSSFLQDTTQPLADSPPKPQSTTKASPRFQVVTELLQTEKNYVGILETILKVFKEEIEKPSQYNGPLLKPQESKIIFGNIPPIYEVHCKIRDELAEILSNWREDHSIGDVILKHAEKLGKIYPPFINFFEKTKEMIAKCDKANPRFHAFLKRCLTKPECGRQTLQELLIRPVQRLPSVMLLLNDILKHTNKSNADHGKVEKALAALKEAMTHINEDKRKIEGKVAMFDIVYDIDNCPPNLLSFHRNFEMRIDVMEISGGLSGRGDHLSLFLFSDSLEICKRRMKALNQMKSPHHKTPHKTPQKAFKHLEMMPLTSVKRVLNVVESDECRNAFALICRNNSEFKEKLYSFTIDCDETKKMDFLTALSKNMANTMCRADYENLMTQVDGKEFNIDMTDMGTNSISKAFKFGKRVSRAFSFNKTPRKLKRAISNMSNMFSQFPPETNTYMGTPGSDLRGRRLASSIDLTDASSPLSSLTNIHEDGFPDSDTVSLGAFSVQDLDSPTFTQPSPMVKRSMTKYMTMGPNSTGKYL
ncbi:protein ECT2-like [Liolophura sinensis]|uniref:protein ECT2-like n=1 Tax=Liolophura sinensis TaxID=3198878 RepID=UPI00315852F0